MSFVASHGWFNCFKARNNLHNVKVSGEAASADVVVAEEFPRTLEIIHHGDYTPQQIFNVDKTGLYWKKMPDRTYISKEEKTMPGFKASKDRLILLLGGNAKALPVVWKSIPKAWVTQAIFQDWF